MLCPIYNTCNFLVIISAQFSTDGITLEPTLYMHVYLFRSLPRMYTTLKCVISFLPITAFSRTHGTVFPSLKVSNLHLFVVLTCIFCLPVK